MGSDMQALHQAYAPYRCSASFPSHPHWGPCQAQAEQRLHRATGEEQDQRRRHIAVDYTSGAEAAGRVGVGVGEDGGGSGRGAAAGAAGAAAVEGRHWDWGRRLQQEKGLPGHSHKQVRTSREASLSQGGWHCEGRYRAGRTCD